MKFTALQISSLAEELMDDLDLYINTDTEEIKLIMNLDKCIIDTDPWEEELAEVEKNWKNHIVITRMSSRDSFKIMEDFVEEVNNPQLQEELVDALNGKKPFRNFKDTINEDEEIRQQWFKHEAKRQEEYLKYCLRNKLEEAIFEPDEKIDLKGKTFKLIENSENGTVNNETIFKYDQKDNMVTADYFGGTVKYGKIIGVLNGNNLDLLYQCLTTGDELKAGKAKALISFNKQGKMKLTLDWQWLNDSTQKGVSEYIEV